MRAALRRIQKDVLLKRPRVSACLVKSSSASMHGWTYSEPRVNAAHAGSKAFSPPSHPGAWHLRTDPQTRWTTTGHWGHWTGYEMRPARCLSVLGAGRQITRAKRCGHPERRRAQKRPRMSAYRCSCFCSCCDSGHELPDPETCKCGRSEWSPNQISRSKASCSFLVLKSGISLGEQRFSRTCQCAVPRESFET